jgi:hypothetical protein
LQPVATEGKLRGPMVYEIKRRPLPPTATACQSERVVRNAMKKGLPRSHAPRVRERRREGARLASAGPRARTYVREGPREQGTRRMAHPPQRQEVVGAPREAFHPSRRWRQGMAWPGARKPSRQTGLRRRLPKAAPGSPTGGSRRTRMTAGAARSSTTYSGGVRKTNSRTEGNPRPSLSSIDTRIAAGPNCLVMQPCPLRTRLRISSRQLARKAS